MQHSYLRLFLLVLIVVCAAPAAFAQAKFVFLVRHAEKASNDARDPDLSDIGQRRAECLARTLGPSKIVSIFATEYKRTQQTAAPTAKLAGIESKVMAAGDAAAVADAARSAGGNVLVVGHSNTIPAILKALTATEMTMADEEYDKLVVVAVGADGKAIATVVGYCML